MHTLKMKVDRFKRYFTNNQTEVSAKLLGDKATSGRYPFVNVAVLKLNKASADRCDVALLAGECHASGALRIPQLRVRVDTGVADTAVQTSHDQRQLNCSQNKVRLYASDSAPGPVLPPGESV